MAQTIWGLVFTHQTQTHSQQKANKSSSQQQLMGGQSMTTSRSDRTTTANPYKATPYKVGVVVEHFVEFCFAAQNTAEAKLIAENKLRKFKNPAQLQRAVIGDIHFIEVEEI